MLRYNIKISELIDSKFFAALQEKVNEGWFIKTLNIRCESGFRVFESELERENNVEIK